MSSSDFSAFALFTAGLAIFAPAVSASISPPGGSDPTGPAITAPYSTSDVTAGTPFNVTWSTLGASTGCGPKVDLVLLYGPSQDQMNPLSYIQQGLLTSAGSYEWTPDTSLTASDATNKYAIELVCEATNAYQYTGRFALANSNSAAGGSNSTSSASTSASTTPKFPSGNSTATPTGTGAVSHTTAATTAKTSTHSIITATVTGSGGSMPTETESESSPTAATTSASSTSSGAASPMKTGISGLLAAAAVAAIAL